MPEADDMGLVVSQSEQWAGSLSEPLRLGDAPHDAETAQLQALWWVNTFRFRAGLPPIDQVSSVNDAASAHADYIVHNADLYEHDQLSIHDQLAERDGFFAETFWDRFEAAGYGGQALREVVAYQATPGAAIAHWMETAYHRLPLLHPDARHLGYAQAVDGDTRVNVLDLGGGDNSTAYAPGCVTWPPDGATHVPTQWDGLESPQPPAPHGGFPSGPVISASFPPNTAFEVLQHYLHDEETGDSINHTMLTPLNDPNLEGTSAIVIYADSPLKAGHTYEVRVRGVAAGYEFNHTWSFTTRPNTNCNLVAQDCGLGRGCFGSRDDNASCKWEGAARYGDTCTYQNDCRAGLTCVGGACRPFCSLDPQEASACQKQCAAGYSRIDETGPYGVCAAP